MAYVAWLFVGVYQRGRSRLWLLAGLSFGLLTSVPWLWARRRWPEAPRLTLEPYALRLTLYARPEA